MNATTATVTVTQDELDGLKFAELMKIARALNVPGRGTARAAQLREGIRAARLTASRKARGTASRAARAAAIAAAEPTIDTPAGKIRVGSVVVAADMLGGTSRHTVTEVTEDIKHGYAGWAADATTRWGYADQIVRVVTF